MSEWQPFASPSQHRPHPHPSVTTLLLSQSLSGTWVSCFLSGTLSYSQWAGIRFFSRKGTGLCGQSQLLRVPTRQTLGPSSPQPGLPSSAHSSEEFLAERILRPWQFHGNHGTLGSDRGDRTSKVIQDGGGLYTAAHRVRDSQALGRDCHCSFLLGL